jgi:hypothetical protein
VNRTGCERDQEAERVRMGLKMSGDNDIDIDDTTSATRLTTTTTASTGRIFIKFDTRVFFENLSRKFGKCKFR